MTKVFKYCIIFALVSLVGLSLEMALTAFEMDAYGIAVNLFSSEQYIRHWQIIIPVWAAISLAVIWLSIRSCRYNVFKPRYSPKKWQMICGSVLPAAVVCALFLREPGFIRSFNVLDTDMYVYQYVYYAFELLLAGLALSFSQRVFDNITMKNTQIPWGGLVLGLTWGLGHCLTKATYAAAVVAFVAALFYGLIYNWLGKDLKKAWPIMYVVFICI